MMSPYCFSPPIREPMSYSPLIQDSLKAGEVSTSFSSPSFTFRAVSLQSKA